MSLLEQIKGGLATEAPNADVSIQNVLFGSNTNTIPAGGISSVGVVLQTPDAFNQDDALLIDHLSADILAAGVLGISITDLNLFIFNVSGARIISLATPIITTLQPTGLSSLLFEKPPLLTLRVLAKLNQLRFPALPLVLPAPLRIALNITLSNPTGAPQNYTLDFSAIYRHVRSLREG